MTARVRVCSDYGAISCRMVSSQIVAVLMTMTMATKFMNELHMFSDNQLLYRPFQNSNPRTRPFSECISIPGKTLRRDRQDRLPTWSSAR